ncbi:radical SAM protein [Paenibacillaceae bacterium]|nr:radical SAM protein [Paenibacillaceae bacterium]
MLIFYPRFTRTFDDLPGKIALLVHGWNGCNLRCCGCHNYSELIARRPADYLTAEQAINRLAKCHQLFDAILLSGGEFLMAGLDDVTHFLTQLRALFTGEIIILTNGTYPDKLNYILSNNLIDGVHLDLKLPFHCLDPIKDRSVFELVLGVPPTRALCQRILQSAVLVIRHNSRTSQIRTVRYPMLSDDYFQQIRVYVETLKIEHNSEVPYFLNPYYPPAG